MTVSYWQSSSTNPKPKKLLQLISSQLLFTYHHQHDKTWAFGHMDRSLQISKTDSADIRFKCPWHLGCWDDDQVPDCPRLNSRTTCGKNTTLWKNGVGRPSLLLQVGLAEPSYQKSPKLSNVSNFHTSLKFSGKSFRRREFNGVCETPFSTSTHI